MDYSIPAQDSYLKIFAHVLHFFYKSWLTHHDEKQIQTKQLVELINRLHILLCEYLIVCCRLLYLLMWFSEVKWENLHFYSYLQTNMTTQANNKIKSWRYMHVKELALTAGVLLHDR